MKSIPIIESVDAIIDEQNAIYIAAYGLEERSSAWLNFQIERKGKVNNALMFRYERPKGNNRISEMRNLLSIMGIKKPFEYGFDFISGRDEESLVLDYILKVVKPYNMVLIDITSMSKILILLVMSALESFEGILRIVYSEAEFYEPSYESYKSLSSKDLAFSSFPSLGFDTILRAKCLSSVHLQGQPTILVAFTSFNEQLVRHMLGTINPYRLIFINGIPPRESNNWRAEATQLIHQKLIVEFANDNEFSDNGLLERSVSTLNFHETLVCIHKLYLDYGLFERIVIAATGSKMQTVGLFFAKKAHRDIHIEYPTPESYHHYISTGIAQIHEIKFQNFCSFVEELKSFYKHDTWSYFTNRRD